MPKNIIHLMKNFVLMMFGFAVLPAGLASAQSEQVAETSVSEPISEDVGSIITDRPDFTESTQTVPRGRVQLESGYTYSRSGTTREHSFGELLVRVAAGGRSEIRVGVNSYIVSHDGVTGRASGKDDVSLGFKVRLSEGGDGWGRPRVSLIGETAAPSGARAFREAKWQPGLKLLLGWDLSERLGLASNINYASASEGGQRFNQFGGSVSLGYAVNERTGVYAEVFGFRPGSFKGAGTEFFNTGVTRLLHDDLQLDARVGVGLNRGTDYFAGVGVSRRF
jgi:hypothetical protein